MSPFYRKEGENWVRITKEQAMMGVGSRVCAVKVAVVKLPKEPEPNNYLWLKVSKGVEVRQMETGTVFEANETDNIPLVDPSNLLVVDLETGAWKPIIYSKKPIK